MWRVLVVLVGTIPIVLLSRRSLGHPRTHGFYRFFAFELLLVLVALNVASWFTDPLSTRQLASWFLLTLSAALVVLAVVQFHRAEHAAPGEGVATDLPFERTSHLVTTGVFRFIRHPMYASLLWLTWGVVLKHVTAASLVLGVLTTGLLVATARVEEGENLTRFGGEYVEYMRRTWLFVPWVF